MHPSRGFAMLGLLGILLVIGVIGGIWWAMQSNGNLLQQRQQAVQTMQIAQNAVNKINSALNQSEKISIDDQFSKDATHVYFLQSLQNGATKKVIVPDADPKTFQRFGAAVNFAGDSKHLYFIHQTFLGFINKDITFPGGHVESGRVTQVSTDIELISKGDPKSFVVDSHGVVDKLTDKPVVGMIMAHDGNQSYMDREERWGCLGDTQGCLGSNSLSITSR